MQRLTAEDFVAKINEHDKNLKLVINSQQELELTVSGEVGVYLGPDPVITGYTAYMSFLGKVARITGFYGLVNDYMLDRLR